MAKRKWGYEMKCHGGQQLKIKKSLFIDPGMKAALPVNRAFREPQGNFLSCTLN